MFTRKNSLLLVVTGGVLFLAACRENVQAVVTYAPTTTTVLVKSPGFYLQTVELEDDWGHLLYQKNLKGLHRTEAVVPYHQGVLGEEFRDAVPFSHRLLRQILVVRLKHLEGAAAHLHSYQCNYPPIGLGVVTLERIKEPFP